MTFEAGQLGMLRAIHPAEPVEAVVALSVFSKARGSPPAALPRARTSGRRVVADHQPVDLAGSPRVLDRPAIPGSGRVAVMVRGAAMSHVERHWGAATPPGSTSASATSPH